MVSAEMISLPIFRQMSFGARDEPIPCCWISLAVNKGELRRIRTFLSPHKQVLKVESRWKEPGDRKVRYLSAGGFETVRKWSRRVR